MVKTTSILKNHLLGSLQLIVGLAIIGWSIPSWSITLDEAKTQGLVGEQTNGYLGVVNAKAPAEVKTLITDVNEKRKSEYQAIAQRNKTELQAVEALAAKTAIERTAPGQYVRLPSGEWVKK